MSDNNLPTNKIPCSVPILTLNSAKTLSRCLESIKDFAEIIILDGNSVDETVEIAKKFGAKVYPQVETAEKNVKIEDFTEVRKKGLSLASYDWILNLDSDEWLSKELVSEIREIIEKGDINVACQAPDLIVLNDGDGPIIKYAWSYPHYSMLRLYNKKADVQLKGGKKVHERWMLGPQVKEIFLKNPVYFSYRPYLEYKKKIDYYLSLAKEEYKQQPFSWKKYFKYTLFGNLKSLFAIFYKSFRIYLKHGFRDVLPFRYTWQSIRYHLYLIKIGTETIFYNKK